MDPIADASALFNRETPEPRVSGSVYSIANTGEETSGQTLVETAVVLSAFFLLLFGLIQFCMMLFGYGNATYACRVAVHYASLHSQSSLAPCTSASITALATSYIFLVPAANLHVTPTWPSGNTVGNTVNVSVTVTYALNIPFYHSGSITVGSSAQRVILN